MGRHDILSLTRQHNPLGYLAGRYWSPSALWVIDLVVVLTGLGFVTAAVNAIIRVLFAMGRERVLPPSLTRLSRRRTPAVAIRAFRTGFPGEFRVWRHLVILAAAVVFFLFPLWGILDPRGRALMDLLPFTALGWLGLGFIAVGVLRARRPARLEALGSVFLPAEDNHRLPRDAECGRGPAESPPRG